MCLAVPGKVVELKENGKTAVVGYGGEKREADNSHLNAEKGDWVIVQFGLAVQKVNEKEAINALNAWNEISGNSRAPSSSL